MADYPGAIDHNVPRSFMFNSNAHAAIVIHKTGGDATPEAIYSTFLATGNSVHYGIGTDGTIWQYVPEALGAGGNCCVEVGYDSFWQPYLNQYGNLNLCTISIEHCDGSLTNSTPLTHAQQEASFKLVAYLVQKYDIPTDHIKGHNSIDPINRARCPGNYPWDELFTFLKGGSMVPQGWTDDGQTLKSPNGVPVVLGFRNFVLSNNWHPDNWALGSEQGVDLLEASNPSLGKGSQQVFRYSMLGYTAERGVFAEWLGVELNTTRQQLRTYYDEYKAVQTQLATLQPEMGKLKQEVADLQAQLQVAQQPTGIDSAKVKDRLSAIALASANGNAVVQQLVNQPLS